MQTGFGTLFQQKLQIEDRIQHDQRFYLVKSKLGHHRGKFHAHAHHWILLMAEEKLLCATRRIKKLKDPWRRWAACHGFSPTTLGTFWLVCWLVGWLVGWLCKLAWHFFTRFFYCGFSCCVHVRRSTFSHPQHAHGHQTTRQRCCHNSCPCQFAFTMPTASSSSRPSGFHFSTCFLICFILFSRT